VWIGCKRLILRLSKVLSVEEVKSPYMPPNQRLIIIKKFYDTHDIQLTSGGTSYSGIRLRALIRH